MAVKKTLKRIPLYPVYLHLRYLAHRYLLERKFKPAEHLPDITLDPVDSGVSFFGYYNISPENRNGVVLYLKVKEEHIRGSLREEAAIMLKPKSDITREIGRTRAWNWQQGCMLQWLPGSDDRILYNDYEEDEDAYVSKVIDLDGQVIRKYDMPVYNVSRNGQFALSLNFDRLAKMRPDYGYFNRKNKTLLSDDQDGIWRLDLSSGGGRLILDLDTLKSLSYSSTMDGALHKVNHIDINPSGSRFMFLHRWTGPAGRNMRLITANPDGSELSILNGDELVSHCCWLDNDHILAFCEYEGKLGYFSFSDRSKHADGLMAGMPLFDGHPSVSPDGKWIITDSYPTKSRFSKLLLFDLTQKRLKNIGRFHQPLKYRGEKRVDLHPKWGLDSKMVYFESAHSGKRQLYCFHLDGL